MLWGAGCEKIITFIFSLMYTYMINRYKTFLMRQELAANTIRSYVWTVTDFLEKYPEVTRENLLAYKGYLMEHHKPQTVNLRLQAINKYLEYMKKDRLKMSFVKVQQKNFLERYNDLALLADLMGHESIETTRIYLRRTATEQQTIVDKIVNW